MSKKLKIRIFILSVFVTLLGAAIIFCGCNVNSDKNQNKEVDNTFTVEENKEDDSVEEMLEEELRLNYDIENIVHLKENVKYFFEPEFTSKYKIKIFSKNENKIAYEGKEYNGKTIEIDKIFIGNIKYNLDFDYLKLFEDTIIDIDFCTENNYITIPKQSEFLLKIGQINEHKIINLNNENLKLVKKGYLDCDYGSNIIRFSPYENNCNFVIAENTMVNFLLIKNNSNQNQILNLTFENVDIYDDINFTYEYNEETKNQKNIITKNTVILKNPKELNLIKLNFDFEKSESLPLYVIEIDDGNYCIKFVNNDAVSDCIDQFNNRSWEFIPSHNGNCDLLIYKKNYSENNFNNEIKINIKEYNTNNYWEIKCLNGNINNFNTNTKKFYSKVYYTLLSGFNYEINYYKNGEKFEPKLTTDVNESKNIKISKNVFCLDNEPFGHYASIFAKCDSSSFFKCDLRFVKPKTKIKIKDNDDNYNIDFDFGNLSKYTKNIQCQLIVNDEVVKTFNKNETIIDIATKLKLNKSLFNENDKIKIKILYYVISFDNGHFENVFSDEIFDIN